MPERKVALIPSEGCPRGHDERFGGVFDLPKGCNGCLACFAEDQARAIRELESLIEKSFPKTKDKD